MKVEIEVPEDMVYELCFLLTDRGGDYGKTAYDWWIRHGVKDAFYDRSVALSTLFNTLARSIAKQAQEATHVEEPIPPGRAA